MVILLVVVAFLIIATLKYVAIMLLVEEMEILLVVLTDHIISTLKYVAMEE